MGTHWVLMHSCQVKGGKVIVADKFYAKGRAETLRLNIIKRL